MAGSLKTRGKKCSSRLARRRNTYGKFRERSGGTLRGSQGHPSAQVVFPPRVARAAISRGTLRKNATRPPRRDEFQSGDIPEKPRRKKRAIQRSFLARKKRAGKRRIMFRETDNKRTNRRIGSIPLRVSFRSILEYSRQAH